jgi:hypothetical protein
VINICGLIIGSFTEQNGTCIVPCCSPSRYVVDTCTCNDVDCGSKEVPLKASPTSRRLALVPFSIGIPQQLITRHARRPVALYLFRVLCCRRRVAQVRCTVCCGRGSIFRATASPRSTSESVQQTTTELGTQQTIDNEVNARVNTDEQLGGRLKVEYNVAALVIRYHVSDAMKNSKR